MPEGVALVTGGTSGLGLACANRLGSLGYRVFAASRSTRAGIGAEWLHTDVCDEASVSAAVEAVLARAGRIDVLVCAAGYALAGSVEQTLLHEARAQLDVNFFGVVRTVRAVLPAMRAQHSGAIVVIGSLAGRIGLPFQAYYSASKGALDAWTEALRLEVAPFGIRVWILEPGNCRTPLTDRRVIACHAPEPPYATTFRSALDVAIRDERAGSDPRVLADTLERILRSRRSPVSATAGRLAERLLWHLKPLLPVSVSERVIRHHFRIP